MENSKIKVLPFVVWWRPLTVFSHDRWQASWTLHEASFLRALAPFTRENSHDRLLRLMLLIPSHWQHLNFGGTHSNPSNLYNSPLPASTLSFVSSGWWRNTASSIGLLFIPPKAQLPGAHLNLTGHRLLMYLLTHSPECFRGNTQMKLTFKSLSLE
jgi:hypothetical protein